MTMNYLIPIIAFLGFVAGGFIKNLVPEEKVPGKKYFVLFEKIILAVLAIYILATFYNNSLNLVLWFIFGFVVGNILRIPYLYLGLAMISFDFVVASLVFIFGIPYGNRHAVWNIIIYILPFLLLLTQFNLARVLMFSSGAILGMLLMYKKNRWIKYSTIHRYKRHQKSY